MTDEQRDRDPSDEPGDRDPSGEPGDRDPSGEPGDRDPSDEPHNAGPAGVTGDPGEPKLEDHLTARTTWLRLLFMIVIAILYGVSRIVVGAVVILQFLWLLFTGGTNDRLTELGQSLAVYTYQIVRYLTFNTELRPFPFDTDWPKPEGRPE